MMPDPELRHAQPDQGVGPHHLVPDASRRVAASTASGTLMTATGAARRAPATG